MGIQINGNTNNINAGIGSLSIEDLREIDIVGVATASNFKTGSSNLHSTGLTVGNALVHSTGVNVGTGATVHSPASNVLTFGTNSNERLRIKSDGAINITTANGNLEWTASSGSNPFIRSVGSGQQSLEFNTGGNEALRITSDGNIGINDSAPPNFTGYTSLSIHGSTGGALVFGDDGTDEWEIYAGDGVVKIYDRANTQERIRISDNGAIGLSGANYGSSGQVLTSQGSGSAATWSTISGTTINSNTNNYLITGTGTANTLQGEANLTFNGSTFQVSGEGYVTGNFSIGEPSPDRKLHVKSGSNSNDGAFRVESANGNIMDMGTDNSMHFLNCVSADPFRIKFAGNEALRLTHETSGNGSTTLQFYMVTNNSQGATPYIKGVCGTEAGGADANNDGGLEFHTKTGGSGTDINAMRINANGRVAIGAHNIQNPTAALHIIGDTSGSNTALQVGQDSGGRYLRVNEVSGQSNFGELLLSFYDNTMPSLLKLQNTYANAANMGTAIQFNGHGGSQTGKISVYNRDANTASNSVMELQASYVTKPSQPGFEASYPDAYNTSSSPSNYVTQWLRVHHNYGNHFNANTGFFTAPLDGRYLIGVIMTNVGHSNPHVAFGINGGNASGPSRGGTNYTETWHSNAGSGSGLSPVHIFDLSKNDYVNIWLYGYTGTADDPRCYFYGYFLG